LDHAHPEVRKDIMDWGVWIVKELDAAGFRFDAVKHMCVIPEFLVTTPTDSDCASLSLLSDSVFIRDFVKHVRKESDKDSLFA
jgi:alpha-amylase